MQTCKQGDHDPVEPRIAGEAGEASVGHHAVRDAAENEHRAGHARQSSSKCHGRGDGRLHRHARVLGGFPRQTHGADPKAEAGSPEQHVDGDREGQRNRHAEMQLGPLQKRGQPRVRRQQLGLWDEAADRVAGLRHERSGEHVVHELDRDEIEHDRAQDLVDVEVGLEGTRDRAPDAAAHRAGHQRERNQHRAGQVWNGQCSGCRREAAHGDLSLAADVEHVGPKGDADTGADEQQRHRLDRRARQRVAVAEGACEQGLVAHDRVGAERQHQHRAHEQGHDCCRR